MMSKKDGTIFAFMLYNSTHHSYYSPSEGLNPFQPAKQIEMSLLSNDTQPNAFVNQYHNAAFFIDQEIGKIKQQLQQLQLWDNSIVIITGDHGEEFNDQLQNYWGHGSNFSRYQMQVPLVMHWPGLPMQTITHRTSHVRCGSHLLQEALHANRRCS